MGGAGRWLLDAVMERRAARRLQWGRTRPTVNCYLSMARCCYAYDCNQALHWEVQLPAVIGGQVDLSDAGSVLLLTSNHGNIAALQKDRRRICGITQVFRQ